MLKNGKRFLHTKLSIFYDEFRGLRPNRHNLREYAILPVMGLSFRSIMGRL